MFPLMHPTKRTKSRSIAFTSSLLMYSITVFVLCGCGGQADVAKKLGTVSGTISAEGEPVTAGQVLFESNEVGASASADLNENGTYTIDSGLPVGNYKVYLRGPEIHGLKDKQGNHIPVTIGELKGVPEKYQALETSDLTAIIEEGENEHSFDIN